MSPANATRLLLLGAPRIEVNSNVLPLLQRDTLICLFVRLALQPNQPHTRRKLAFSIWADISEQEALANLRRHLYLLRKTLPETLRPALKISTQSVLFDLPSNVWVDVTAFERPASSRPDMEAAVALYTGELAQGVEVNDFILVRREELRARYLGLLLSLAKTCMEQEEPESVIRWARKLISHDPWNEEAVRLCMTAEARLGNRSAALTMYKTLEENLQSAIGAQPMPESMALYREILHNHLRPVASRHPSAEWLPFVGRDNELTVLKHALHDIQKKHGGFVFIHGPAGVGKTTLIREALRRYLPAEAVQIFWGNCQPTGVERPYGLWQQILNLGAPLLARRADVSPEWLNQLLPLIPDLSLLRSGLIPFARPDTAELRSALRQGIYALASDQPLVVIIEDSHWMDTASLEFLNELTDGVFQQPILFLITHRIEDSPLALLDLKRILRRKRASQDLLLQAFTPAETQTFLETALKTKNIPFETLTEVSRYAEGMPLLLREAAQILRKQRQTQTKGDALPSLHESLKIRLGSLTLPARDMLETAAILGFSLAENELQAALQWQPEAYAAALDILQSERLLLENTRIGGDDHTFSHHLIHQIILDEIPNLRAKQLRARAAQALEQIHADETGFAAEIASQYEQADLFPPAARFWLKHAQESTDLAAFETALASIARAERLLTDTDTDPQIQELRAQAALQRGVIALYQGHGEHALHLLEQAVTQTRPFPSLFANALSMQAYALYTRDQSKNAHRAADQAFNLSLTLNDTANAVRALNIRAVSALMLGQTSQAIDDLGNALSLLEQNKLSASAQTVQSLNHLGTALVFAQDYTQARQILDRTVKLSNQGGLRRLEAAALTMLGQIALNCGQYENAIRTYDRAIEVAGSSYLPGMWGKFAGRGWALARCGNLSAARKDFTHGLEAATKVESRYGQILMRCYLTFTALAAGEPPSASLADLEAESAALNLHPVVFFAANIQGQLWRILQNEQKAQAAHARAAAAAHASKVPSFIQMARLQEMLTHAIQNQTIELNELSALHRSALDSGEAPLQTLAHLVKAYQALRTGSLTHALTEAQSALILARSCPDQQLIGDSLLLMGRLYCETHDETQAQACYAEVRALANSAFAPLKICLPETEEHSIRDNLLKGLL
ncbi:MAG: AAA family ATPase [Chloroflexi bacterium]|nr:AAA family ATPase [Chloroflexota bacterium]